MRQGNLIKALLLCGFLAAAQAGILYSSEVGLKLTAVAKAEMQTTPSHGATDGTGSKVKPANSKQLRAKS